MLGNRKFENKLKTWCDLNFFYNIGIDLIDHNFLRATAECFARLSHRRGVRPSVWTLKQARITKSSLWATTRTLISKSVKVFKKNFLKIFSNKGVKWKGVQKIDDFEPISRRISETVRDRA